MKDDRPVEEPREIAEEAAADESAGTEEPEAPEARETTDPARELAELQDRYLRLAAEFDNYRRRRADRDRQQRLNAFRELLEALLPAVDDLHLAVEHETEDAEAFRHGLRALIDKLDRALTSVGVERLKPLGELFDPQMHECLALDERAEAEPGTVTSVFADGYRLGDIVLRPAKVVIAQPAEDDE